MSDFISNFVSGVLGAVKRSPGRAAGIFAAIVALVVILAMAPRSEAQTELAGVSGRVTDPSGAVIVDAEVEIKNVETNVLSTAKTNQDGLYVIPSLHPGQYLINVRKPGFKSVTVTQLTLNVQDNVVRNFALQVGSVSETVTINGSGLNINTTDAAVSTVVDRQFVENMPLNGRSFQNLLTLSPGVALVPSAGGAGWAGEISVNGQRTEANYFNVDGVSANTGAVSASIIVGAGVSGGVPGETVLGTTQSMVSVDALQEFRASTSTYSAEYGRTPGGQFSFTTRSGTNDWHGSAFDYFRNEVLDANNWFNNYADPKVPRLPERQNDFGGTLGGPILIPHAYNGRDKTFFFFSYEGLRLMVPQPVNEYSVPDMALRQQAPAALQPFLNAFPVPNGGEDGLGDGLALYNLAYSSPSDLDNVGVRIDHSFGEKLRLFGRYANTESNLWTFSSPAIRNNSANQVRTLTIGATTAFTQMQVNELRFNITQNNSSTRIISTDFGGAIPLDFSSIPGPNGQVLTSLGTEMAFFLGYGGFPNYILDDNKASQRQYNLTDTHTWSHGVHHFKFGIDWRRLTTYIRPVTLGETGYFSTESEVLTNTPDVAQAYSYTYVPVQPVYHNFSTFVQDEWKATSRLSFSLGLRWDVNPAPGNLIGPLPYTVDQISNLATLKIAPANTSLWKTDWGGFAPRLGMAYQLRQSAGHETVLRSGFGLFYDMGNTEGSQGFGGVGFQSSSGNYPSFPLTSPQVTLPAPSVATPYGGPVYGFDPNLKLPYTLQWNLAVEQSLGVNQVFGITYVGSSGRQLLAQFNYFPSQLSNPNFGPNGFLSITANRADSNYNALQLKYQKRLSHGLQVLSSYTWSHSIDNLSTNFNLTNSSSGNAGALFRSSSDFDIRHNFQAAVTYEVPGSYSNPLAASVLMHWGVDLRISARSALPVDILEDPTVNPVTGQQMYFRPDIVPGQPIYLYGSQYPARRIINYNAFQATAGGENGDTPRNLARGFDAVQADVALRRDFPIRERVHLQFRAEAFNILNHPIFGSIRSGLGYGPYNPSTGHGFGTVRNTLNTSLGGLSSLYQSGGPRSLQLMLKLQF